MSEPTPLPGTGGPSGRPVDGPRPAPAGGVPDNPISPPFAPPVIPRRAVPRQPDPSQNPQGMPPPGSAASGLHAVVLLSCPSRSGDLAEGTGFFYRADGYLLTNYHVVEDAREMWVIYRGRAHRAYYVNGNADLDLAILRVFRLTPATLPLGDSDQVRPGDEVLVAGYPLGSRLGPEPTLTRGIISSLRHVPNGPAILQLDAALNPGNSGGPVLSRSTRTVLGMATAKVSGASGIGFALPSNLIKEFIQTTSHRSR